MRGRFGAALGVLAMLSACGGGGSGAGTVGSGGGGSTGGTGTPTASPTPTATTGCSLRERQDWALAQLREWYLFPETLPASPDPTSFTTVGGYIDLLTATARAQGKDRYFTYLTSIAEENAYYSSGSTAGYGVRFALDSTGRRLLVTEAFEGGPALAAGIDRGTEITQIGTSSATLRDVSSIIAAEGTAGLTTALGPDSAGTTRTFRFRTIEGTTTTANVAKTDFNLLPVSTRYGAKVLQDGSKRVGYINLRTFISPANQPLRDAFASFRAQGITEFVIDFRYNGGGLISVAELMGDLLGGGKSGSDVYSYTSFRPEKASENTVKYFAPTAQSVTPTKIAFIGTGNTASASELVINAFVPYLGNNMALVGTNTYGKPVGQIGLDRAGCDDRLRVVALAVQNSARSAAYYNGLATTVPNTCQASDDISYPLGDVREQSVARALDFLAGRQCSRIGASASARGDGLNASPRSLGGEERTLLQPDRPSTVQREVPGLF
ncbi:MULTISPECIES: S41 family peptidase [unclassified Sphingomonas]|uniref:S41 family peptidase n=1 Tax=unclassified Sphingomonas TaxID=196159 RepID=UPI001910733A|nr:MULTISPECIES: S41 family peptidase [unclassified Sphingomonas]